MEGNYITYDHLKSFQRIDDIIAASDNSFEELKEIPSRDKLTFTNGFYVNCSALFVDIRNSSELPSKHKRPKLAKLYRCYLSEIVAVMNGEPCCAEVNIIGDGVLGIFNTTSKIGIWSVFSTAVRIASLIDVLNYKFKKNSIEEITVGIGMSYGRALMIKAGYIGSSINDVVWMGEVVNEAAKLSSYGNKNYLIDREIMVSSAVYINLHKSDQNLLTWNLTRNCYHGNIINVEMNEWYKENCKSVASLELLASLLKAV